MNSLSLAQHTIRDSFSLSPSLAQAISQSRFSLAYYIFTYIQRSIEMKEKRSVSLSCFAAVPGDQTRDLFWLWAALPPIGQPFSHSFIHSFIHFSHTRAHRLSDVSFPELCLIHLRCTGNPSPLFSVSFQPFVELPEKQIRYCSESCECVSECEWERARRRVRLG